MTGLPNNHTIYHIDLLNNRVMDVMNGHTADDSTVWTYPYTGAACQEWEVIKVNNVDYAFRDTNSGKYLTVKNGSSSLGAELVITSKNGAFSNSQLFKIEQYSSFLRYKIKTKCSNYTKAIGYDGYYLEQVDASDYNAQLYFTEAGIFHGFQDGNTHIQSYSTAYDSHNKFLCSIYGTIDYDEFNSSHKYDWSIKYYGNGYFTLSNDGCFLAVSNGNVNASTFFDNTINPATCLWSISKNGDYYQIIPKAAITTGISTALGNNGTSIKLVNQSSNNSKWRIIREHYYYSYDMAIYVAEDFYHANHYSPHSKTFQYAIPSIYLRGFDNQILKYQTGDGSLTFDDDDLFDMIQKTRLFIFRGHGSNTSINLSARDGNQNFISPVETYNLSEITAMSNDELNNLSCAIFLCCHSAEGAYTNPSSNNFVTGITSKGCDAAIGFDGKVDCNLCSGFADTFFDYYSTIVGSPALSSRDSFLYAIGEMDYCIGQDFKPFMKYYSLTYGG